MSLIRSIATGLRSLFRKEQVDRDLDEQLHGYQEIAAEEKMGDGQHFRSSSFESLSARGPLSGVT